MLAGNEKKKKKKQREKFWTLMILKYKTKGNKLKQEKNYKKKKKKKKRSLDGFGQNCPNFFWTVFSKPSRITSGRFGSNRLEFRTVLPKPS